MNKASRERHALPAAEAPRLPGGVVRAQPRIGRPPKGKTLLSQQRLLKEALAIVDEQGLDALSMRALAERLSVTAMSLYRYCDSHQALLDAVRDEILAAHPPRPVTREQSWREVTTEMARALRRAFQAHPHAAALFATQPVRSQRLAVHADAVLGRLVEAGFGLSIAAYLLETVSAFTIGHCLSAFGQPVAATARPEAEPAPASPSPSPSRDERELPFLSQVARKQGGDDFEAEFVVGLVAILDGFANRYAKRPR